MVIRPTLEEKKLRSLTASSGIGWREEVDVEKFFQRQLDGLSLQTLVAWQEQGSAMSESDDSNGTTGVPPAPPSATADENLTDYLFDARTLEASFGGDAKAPFDKRNLFHASIARRILHQLSSNGDPDTNTQVGR
jgi:hypothetical protein